MGKRNLLSTEERIGVRKRKKLNQKAYWKGEVKLPIKLMIYELIIQ